MSIDMGMVAMDADSGGGGGVVTWCCSLALLRGLRLLFTATGAHAGLDTAAGRKVFAH